MIETARQVAYKYDIPLDDSCWRVVVRKSSTIALLGVPARDIKKLLCPIIFRFWTINLTAENRFYYYLPK